MNLYQMLEKFGLPEEEEEHGGTYADVQRIIGHNNCLKLVREGIK